MRVAPNARIHSFTHITRRTQRGWDWRTETDCADFAGYYRLVQCYTVPQSGPDL